MSSVDDSPEEIMWQGRFVVARRRGRWEYVSRARNIRAAVILAIDEGHVLLVEQYRVPLGQFDADPPQRHPELLHQQDMTIVDCQDHRGADVAGAADIFPSPTLLGDHEAPLPHDFFSRVGVLHSQTSISRSGSSLTSFS